MDNVARAKASIYDQCVSEAKKEAAVPPSATGQKSLSENRVCGLDDLRELMKNQTTTTKASLSPKTTKVSHDSVEIAKGKIFLQCINDAIQEAGLSISEVRSIFRLGRKRIH